MPVGPPGPSLARAEEAVGCVVETDEPTARPHKGRDEKIAGANVHGERGGVSS